MKKLLKGVLRRVIKPIASRIHNLLEEEPAVPDFSKDDTSYPWLNWLLITALRKAKAPLRPNYTWALLHAGHLAKTLGMQHICAIEFGVAGERLALTEFNNTHQMRKISPIFGLEHFLPQPYSGQPWRVQRYMAHIFDHDLYGHSDGLVKRPNDGFTALS